MSRGTWWRLLSSWFLVMWISLLLGLPFFCGLGKERPVSLGSSKDWWFLAHDLGCWWWMLTDLQLLCVQNGYIFESEGTRNLTKVLWFELWESRGKMWFPSDAADGEAAVLLLRPGRGGRNPAFLLWLCIANIFISLRSHRTQDAKRKQVWVRKCMGFWLVVFRVFLNSFFLALSRASVADMSYELLCCWDRVAGVQQNINTMFQFILIWKSVKFLIFHFTE